MPYPRAHWWVLFVGVVILVGFWPSYWSVFSVSRWQFHLHGVVASVWVAMVFAQSWSAHHKQLPLHRATGKASLMLFPFLIGGLMGIIDVTAKNYAIGDETLNPVTMAYGPAFLIGLMVAVAAYLTLYYRALKYRRKVWIHAGYLLGTPIILFESPFSRVMNFIVPGFTIRGPEDFDRILPSIIGANALALIFCLIVWRRVGERGKPFLVTGGFVALQMLVMGTMNDVAFLSRALTALGSVPSITMVGMGVAMGAAAAWLGWEAGKKGAAKRSAVAA